MSKEIPFFYGYPPLSENETPPKVRLFERSDIPRLVQLMEKNFDGPAFSLYPKDVIDAYKAANRETDVKHAINAGGTEVYLAESEKGDLCGFVLIRYNQDRIPRQNAYGELDLRRLHVNPEIHGQGVGKALFDAVHKRAKELHVEYITTHASGSARLYFERHGWKGKTILNQMSKRQTASLVYAAEKPVSPGKITLYTPPTHVVYAGSNEMKKKFLESIVKNLPVISVEADEDLTPNVVVASRSKALNAASSLYLAGRRPLIVSSDVRTDLMEVKPVRPKYELTNRGKPSHLEEVRRNFQLLLETAVSTKKPAPYIVRSATYIHNPLEPELDSLVENDVSVHLTKEALETLSTEPGLLDYRNEVYDTYHIDILHMAAGFALPIFIKRGYVAGLYQHPFDCLPEKEANIQRAYGTVIGGIDENSVRERVGI